MQNNKFSFRSASSRFGITEVGDSEVFSNQTHEMVFYIVSDFRQDAPIYWDPVDKLYESLRTQLILPPVYIYKNPTPSYLNNITYPVNPVYAPNQIYNFNITAIDDAIYRVYLEFNGINYTVNTC